MGEAGYRLKIVDDNADYAQRMRLLRADELDLAVATIDAYLLTGPKQGFPATIVSVLDESKGGDALMANPKELGSLDDLNSKAKSVRVAFTPQSPSEHLLKSVAVHFDLSFLLEKGGKWRVETDGAEAAFKSLRDGKVSAAALWEPFVSKAAAAGFIKLIGSEDTEHLIVDVLLANRNFAASKPDVLNLFLNNYYRTLKTYRDDPSTLTRDLRSHTGSAPAEVESMLKGVQWLSLDDNVRWFGLGNHAGGQTLSRVVESTVKTLIQAKDFSASPLADGDPLSIQNSSFVYTLMSRGVAEDLGADDSFTDSLTRSFPQIAAVDWDRLKPVGTLQLRPVTFRSGTEELDDAGMRQLEDLVEIVRHYPNYRILVEGHSGLRGDLAENVSLSQGRADAVRAFFTAKYSVDPHRMRAVGLGPKSPLTRGKDESDRAYDLRLKRVDIRLLTAAW